jgi:signal transduction histidine kinase/CheY-like chemotaxis protein/HPt (histidine-containing phosphotransfer) domain-containing protein
MGMAAGLFAPAFLAVAIGTAAPMDLSGPWLFQLGDDVTWAEPARDDTAWPVVHVPTGWGRTSPSGSLAWYRRRVQVNATAAHAPPGLAVLIGNVDSAYEIYAGGQLLGGVGALPPAARMDYDRHRLYMVPPSAVDPDGRLVLALRVWKSPDTESSIGGPVEGRFLIGSSLELQRQMLLGDMVQLFLGGLFILVGLYHLQLFGRRPLLREYLWYALVAMGAGLYCLLRTQWKYDLTDRFVLLKEVEYVVLLLLPALCVQFVWPLVGVRIPPLMRAYQAASVALAFVVAATPGLWLNTHSLPIWELSLLPLVVATLVALARQAVRGHPEARTITMAMAVFMLFALHDVAVDRGIVATPRVTAFGFATLVLSMAVSLANRWSRAQAELATLSRDLEQRVLTRTEELSRRTAEASAANLAKSQFLATMSHEIRTPLNAVIGMTGLVLDTSLHRDQRESLEIVRRSGQALLEIVNEILDFSKVESGTVELDEQPFSLRACIEEAMEVVAPRAADRGLDLAYVAADDLPVRVRGDAGWVRQVLVNLLSNAVKFTPSGGVMVTACSRANPDGGPAVEVAVSDTGIGIPADRRALLFQPFSQIDAAHSREYGGTGLGLAISRRLAGLMGGTLWLGDEDGPGSVFHFTLSAPAVPGEIPLDLQLDQPDLGGRIALVVGAGPFTLRMIAACLSSWGIAVRVAASEDEAAETVRKGAVDVALIGFDPDGSGERLAERLRALRPADQLPFVAFGPLSARQRMGGAVRLGVLARLVTPLRRVHLHNALLDAFGARVVSSRTAEQLPIGRDAADSRPLRILLAEDNIVNQKVALQMLDRLGYRADVAANGREVLEALGRQAYDVVLLDVQMPEMDGLEAARRIRARWNPPPRLVALTANALREDREDCLAAGMHDYLSKPVSRDELAAALRRSWDQGPGGHDDTATVGPGRSLEPTLDRAAAAPAVPPAAPDDGPVVLATEPLEQLREMQDASNPTFLSDLVEEFLGEVPQRLASMETAIGQGDHKALRLLVHTLKGNAGMLGGRRLEASCFAMERAAQAGADGDLPALLLRVRADFEGFRGRLLAEVPPAARSGL